MNETLRKVTV